MAVIGGKKSNAGVTVQIRDPNEEGTHCITIKNSNGSEVRNRIKFLFEQLGESPGNEVYIRHYKNNGGVGDVAEKA